MTFEEKKKQYILSVIKNEGKCWVPGRPPAGLNCMGACIITGKDECFDTKESYRLAVIWMKENHPDTLLEILI